jgi:hypothetical protein
MGRSLETMMFELLTRAQNRFGPRDPSYAITIKTGPGSPHTFYSGPREILIRVSPDCETDEVCALREIGHEVVHCLGPDPGNIANYLEEGTAQVFALDATALCGHFRLSPKPPNPYWRAEWLVRKLLDLDPDTIKRIRATEPRLSAVSADLILRACHPLPRKRLPRQLAEELTTRFPGVDHAKQR